MHPLRLPPSLSTPSSTSLQTGPSPAAKQPVKARGKVYVYTSRAAVLAHDVEHALNILGVRYVRVNDRDIKTGILTPPGVLIIPGGYTSQYVSNLGPEGFENVRKLVGDGGGYIGICAGAYIAAPRVELPGRPRGLGIINIKNHRRRGRGIIPIRVLNPEHPVMKGYLGK